MNPQDKRLLYLGIGKNVVFWFRRRRERRDVAELDARAGRAVRVRAVPLALERQEGTGCVLPQAPRVACEFLRQGHGALCEATCSTCGRRCSGRSAHYYARDEHDTPGQVRPLALSLLLLFFAFKYI